MIPDIAVVIVTYNSEFVVGELLDGLPAALDGLNADVVVVDNASSDGTVALIQSRDDCRVVPAANLGYAAGINRGASESTHAPAILVLNPDVRLSASSVPMLLNALRLPNTGIVAPRVLAPDGTLSLSLRREPNLARALGLGRTAHPKLSEHVMEMSAYDHPHVVDWALGAVLLISRQCFDALGGWDESFFLYSEETDFCLRAREHGFVTRYEPLATSVHIGGQSGQNASTHAMQIVNRVRLYRRRHTAIPSLAYFSLAFLSELSWVARGNPRSLEAIRALICPSRRPAELGASNHFIPR